MKFASNPLLELKAFRDTARAQLGEPVDSLEGFGDNLRYIIPATVDVLNSLTFSGNVPRLAEAAKARLSDLIEKYKYSELRSQFVQVPAEISVTYLEYAKLIEESAHHVSKFQKSALEPFGELVSELLVNHTQLLTSDDQAASRIFSKGYRDQLSHSLAAMSNDGQSNHKRYGDMVARNADWAELFTRMEAISTELNKVDHNAVMRRIGAIKEQLTVLLKRVDAEALQVSPETLVNIADGVYELAREAEFVSLITVRAIGLHTAVNDTIARLYLKLK